MEAIIAAPSGHAEHVQTSADQLRGDSQYLIAAGAMALSVGWFILLDESSRASTWLPPLGILASCALSLVVARRRSVAGAMLLVLTILVGNAVFLWSHGDPPAAFFFVATVCAAGALLGPVAAVGFGIACTGVIAGAALDPRVALLPGTALAAAVLVWFGVILTWASTYPVYTALSWAWTSYVDALRRTDELRDRQGELNQALASLNETCLRLEVVNQELARARAAAEEARQLKTEFAANISHELRTPLNLIIGFSEILMATPGGHNPGLTPEARADVDVIHRNARHLSNLIDDVLDLSQVDAGRMGLTKERACLSTIAGEAINAVNRLYEVRGLVLTNLISEDLPTVYVDRTRIRQVLINLLANAARFTATGGASVTGEVIEGSIAVHVVDTGVGIAPEDIPKVFEEFRQLDGTTRRQHDGSGLGLAICQRFVELHGGSIWAESEPGRGTTFSFTLPLIDNIAASTLRPEWDTWVRIAPAAEEPTKAVVLVNQDPRVERLFQRYLEGYRILPAADEAEALRLFTQTPVHGVLLATTPGTPLTDRIQKLREAPRNVPVIVCSLPSSASMGSSIGVTDYLVKPISADRLIETLNHAAKKAHTVLIVDDDPEMVRLLARMIRTRARRFQVLRAYGGAAALAMLREHTPDIVILDLVMPDIDGYTVLREMRLTDGLRDIPVVAVTARSYEAETFAAGALEITREGGLSVGELMACLKSSLDSITTPAGSDATPRPAGVR